VERRSEGGGHLSGDGDAAAGQCQHQGVVELQWQQGGGELPSGVAAVDKHRLSVGHGHTPKGQVSGTPCGGSVGKGVTALVSSNQTQASNCSGSTASK